ncbi:BREX-3 system phosphatase PglZ [Caldicoprobacter algeriensis]|nr:BREX-3 system phosphatase PglZ [Caldicoprobacter algeriensis]
MGLLCQYILEKMAVDYENQILLFDYDDLCERSGALRFAHNKGFQIIEYADPEEFRYFYELKLRDNKDVKVIIRVMNEKIYVPYDIRKRYYNVFVDYASVFPRLDPVELKRFRHIDLDLLYIAYQNCFSGVLGAKATKEFIEKEMFSRKNADEFVDIVCSRIERSLREKLSYRDWFEIARDWARVRLMVDGGFSGRDVKQLCAKINGLFKVWMLANYGLLSASTSVEGPVMVHKINDYMLSKSQRIALIVIDGMSLENWLTILASCPDLEYDIETVCCFAMIPTVTTVSRQSIFSGKLPISHSDAFSLKDEEKQWIEYWVTNGYRESDVYFGRDIEVDLPHNIKVVGIIVNFIDDLMHGQMQGQKGMYWGVAHWAGSGELKKLIGNFINRGFDVYIASDHGNVEAIGQGRPKNDGVLTEMTSLRARVYQDFAITGEVEEKFKVFTYPGTYMPKGYRYLICDRDTAFGIKGQSYVCHGGMSIEEVIVPFARIKGM